MIVKKTKAVAPTTAPNTVLLKTSYLKTTPVSTDLKQQLGELLFCLEFTLDRDLYGLGCKVFENMLNTYYEVKSNG